VPFEVPEDVGFRLPEVPGRCSPAAQVQLGAQVPFEVPVNLDFQLPGVPGLCTPAPKVPSEA